MNVYIQFYLRNVVWLYLEIPTFFQMWFYSFHFSA